MVAIEDGNNSSIKATILSDGSVIFSEKDYSKKFETNASGQPIYIGIAIPGTLVGSTGWKIQKLIYGDGDNMPPTEQLWASSTAKFDKIWTDRATYNYG